jgi:hypothetical protein
MNKNLENCILFKGLNSFLVNELLHIISFKERKYDKNDLIAQSDDEVRDLLIVVEGSVRGEMVDFTGKTIKIEDVESPRMLARALKKSQVSEC